MNQSKRLKLERKGWKVGTVKQFLNLTEQESDFVEIRLALCEEVRRRREQKELTQVDMAKLIGSSQSRVAKLEAGDLSVSLDLMVRTLIALGAKRKDLGQVIGCK